MPKQSKNQKQNYTREDFQNHLEEEHSISPFSSYLREIVYGGSDGIVTTFAIVAGFSGATGGSELSINIPIITVLIFGLANLFGDATSMAVGNFMSIRSEQDVYKDHKRKEHKEIQNNPEMEWEETVLILKKKGYNQKDAEAMAQLYKKNKKYWTEFMMEHELEMSNPLNDSALLTSVATFFSFVIFGFIPLIPYILFRDNSSVFMMSILFTLFALVGLGALRWRAGQSKALRAIGEIVLLGGVSATVAYFIGSLFRL